MAETSKYLQLDPQILVEYIYTDPASPEIIETDANGARILILDNSYIGANNIFNEDNPVILTGNYRYRSAIPVNSNKSTYAYLTNTNALNYLDFDTNLPSVNELLGQESTLPNVPVKNPQYDTIRIHLVSGYSFEGLGEGFIFEAFLRDRNNNRHSLASIIYRPADNYETLNPVPFIVGEKLYTKYIELKVISPGYLTDEYFVDKTNTSGLAYLLTSGNGLPAQNTVELSIKYVAETQVLNGQTYFLPGEGKQAAINIRDEYSSLVAVIEESTAGDYFELYGEYNGDIFEDFIVELNSEPDTDISVIHDIQVLEQIGTAFTKTSEMSFIQNDDFDTPYRFRPIVYNSHIATSYRILYTLRLLNTVDNSQIIRTVQYASFDVKKYGRRIRKLNLGTVPSVTKVYNTLPGDVQNIVLNNDVTFTVSNEGSTVVKQTEFVLGFKESFKVSASTTAVKTTPAVNQEGDIIPTASGEVVEPGEVPLSLTSTTGTNKIYPQGEAGIIVSPFDDFVKFVFYDNSVQEATGSSEPRLLDLSSVGTLYLSFYDSLTNDEVRIQNYTNITGLNPAQGEAVFKIDKESSKKILGFKSNSFYVSSRLEIGTDKSDETLLYNGVWYSPEDKFSTVSSEIIEELNNNVKSKDEELAAEKQASAKVIEDLSKVIEDLRKDKQILENKVTELNGNLSEILVDRIEENAAKTKELEAQALINQNQSSTSNDDTQLLNNMLNKIKRGKGKNISVRQYERRKGKNAKKFRFRP